MIDMRAALKGEKTDDIDLLASHAIITHALKECPAPPDCAKVRKRCDAVLRAWWADSKDDPKDEATVLGWLNLLAEICRLPREKGAACATCRSNHGPANDPPPPVRLIELLRCTRDPEFLKVTILGPAATSDGVEPWDNWQARHTHWQGILFAEVRGRQLSQSDVGQTLVMHVLEVVLERYVDDDTAHGSAILNLLLVPLLNAVYDDPDRAHTIYGRYFHATPTGGSRSPLHILYDSDLIILEAFRSGDARRRGRALSLIRANAAESNPHALPPGLAHYVNEVVHGTAADYGPVDSPHPKTSLLSQLTCLIRDLHDSSDADPGAPVPRELKKYKPYLAGVHYREARILENASPARFKWFRIKEERETRFLEAVSQRYQRGYEVDFLSSIFSGSEASNLPLWVQDGEVTFLWLLTVLTNARKLDGTGPTAWLLDAPDAPELTLDWEMITRSPGPGPGISCGKSLQDFSVHYACLFKKQDKLPGPKAWALLNFLHRVVTRSLPTQYGPGSTLHPFITSFYKTLLSHGASSFSYEHFRDACRALDVTTLNAYTIQDTSQLPTFLLELLLRSGQDAPYSLFFYPITFEHSQRPVPAVFLAGTFAGLEYDCYPSVTARHNYHLFAILDALRPIIDFEIGRVMTEENAVLRMQVRKTTEADAAKRLAETRAHLIDVILPEVHGLTKLFQDARGLVHRIETGIDPDWSGLFMLSSGAIHIDMFRDDTTLTIRNKKGAEPDRVVAVHKVKGDDPKTQEEQESVLYSRLLYLAREIDKYPGEALGDTTKFFNHQEVADSIAKSTKKPFETSPFLSNLLWCAVDREPSAAHLNQLLKLFTVDAADPRRGVHVAQIAAALGMSGEDSDLKREDWPSVTLCRGQHSKCISNYSFNPTKKRDIPALCEIIAEDWTVITAAPACTAYAKLCEAIEPFRFLRALRLFARESLRKHRAVGGDTSSWVGLKRWSVLFTAATDSTPARIVIKLYCTGQFPVSVRTALRRDPAASVGDYHDLRSNARALCDAIGDEPSFVSIPSALAAPEPDPEHPYYICDYNSPDTRTRGTLITLMLGARGPAEPREKTGHER